MPLIKFHAGFVDAGRLLIVKTEGMAQSILMNIPNSKPTIFISPSPSEFDVYS